LLGFEAAWKSNLCTFLVHLLPIALLCGSGLLLAQETHFGGNYQQLTVRQKQLVNLWIAEFQKIFNKPANAATVYDRLPLSARTTFEAVTHALSRSQMTSCSGKPLCAALDLVELVDRVS
jgi:hypothetical protein